MKLRSLKFKSVKSTNDIALMLIKKDNITPSIILSERQTKGRGTMGKKWISLKGNIFASIFFELKQNMPNFKEFSLINPLIIKNIDIGMIEISEEDYNKKLDELFQKCIDKFQKYNKRE